MQMANEDPSLAARLNDAVNPARFVYEHVKERELLDSVKEFGSLENLKEAMLAEAKAEVQGTLETKLKEKQEEQSEKAKALKPSLAKEPGESGSTEALPQSLEDLEASLPQKIGTTWSR